MSVCKRKRRKIICNNREYIWYVRPHEDYFYRFVLHIISPDKSVVIMYPLDCDYIVSIGRSFQSHETSGHWERYKLPFEKVQACTPEFVSKIIEWTEYGTNAESVSWNDKDIWL